jgi:predicted exporter
MGDSRWSVIPGVLIVLAAAAIIAVRFSGEPPIETDILQSLPGGGDDRIVADAIRRAGAAAGSRMTFAVRGRDEKLREAAARNLTLRLTQTGLFAPVVGEGRDIARWLFANRTEILCPADERKLLQGRGNEIAREALVRLYTPGTPISGDLLSRDPFLLSFRLTQCLMPRSPRADAEAAIVAGRLVASPYRLDVQDKIAEAVTGWRAEWADRGVTLDRSGAVFHAHAGAIRARREISIIGGVSTVAIVVLFWVVFRRYRAPVLAVATVLCGIGGGLALVLIAFDRVHVMALVFGSALTGIAVDYAIHFMMTGLAAPGAAGSLRRRRVWRPMTVGMVTSVCGFSAILLFSTSVMSQVAVFAVGGLIAAWTFSLSVLPAIDESGDSPSRLAKALASAAGRILRPRLPGWAYATCAMAMVVVVAAGFARLTFMDDVRALQKPPADLKVEEDRIAELTGFKPSIQFLLSIGEDYDAAKRAEERALALMHAQGGAEAGGVMATTRFDPSAERRDRIRALLESALLAPHLRALSADLGLASENPDRAYDTANDKGNDTVRLPEVLGALHGVSDGSHYLIAPLGSEDVVRLQELEPLPMSGVRLVDPAERYSRVLAEYRRLATIAFVAAAGVCGLIVLGVYRKFAALRILLPPILGAFGATALLALAGVPFSFFSAMALLIVLGTGIDFAVFQWETKDGSDQWTLAAVALAASTSILSMGLLGISTTYPVRAFGLTVSTGVALSMLFSSLARPVGKDASSGPTMRTLLAGLLVFVFASGCATPEVARPPAVPIGKNLSFKLPSPPGYPQEITLLQTVRATYGNQRVAFQTVASLAADKVHVVITLPTGPRLMTIDWSALGVTTDRSNLAPPDLRGENVLADLVIALWDLKAVRAALPDDATAVQVDTIRTISRDGREVVTVLYSGDVLRTGRMVITNHDFGYELVIASQRIDGG